MTELQPRDWEVRTAAYRHLIEAFTAPDTEELSQRLSRPRRRASSGPSEPCTGTAEGQRRCASAGSSIRSS